MRTLAVANTLHLLDELAFAAELLEVDEGVGAVRRKELALVVARVDADDAVADSGRVLSSEMTQPSSRTRDDEPVTGLRVGLRNDNISAATSQPARNEAAHLLDSLPDSDAGTENRSSHLERESVGDGREVTCERDGVLLERAVDGVARALGKFARRLGAEAAVLAVEAGVGEPLQTT